MSDASNTLVLTGMHGIAGDPHWQTNWPRGAIGPIAQVVLSIRDGVLTQGAVVAQHGFGGDHETLARHDAMCFVGSGVHWRDFKIEHTDAHKYVAAASQVPASVQSELIRWERPRFIMRVGSRGVLLHGIAVIDATPLRGALSLSATKGNNALQQAVDLLSAA